MIAARNPLLALFEFVVNSKLLPTARLAPLEFPVVNSEKDREIFRCGEVDADDVVEAVVAVEEEEVAAGGVFAVVKVLGDAALELLSGGEFEAGGEGDAEEEFEAESSSDDEDGGGVGRGLLEAEWKCFFFHEGVVGDAEEVKDDEDVEDEEAQWNEAECFKDETRFLLNAAGVTPPLGG